MSSKYLFWICVTFCLYSINLAQGDLANSNLVEVETVTMPIVPTTTKLDEKNLDMNVLDTNIGLVTGAINKDNKKAAQSDPDDSASTTAIVNEKTAPIVVSTTVSSDDTLAKTTGVVKENEIKTTQVASIETTTIEATTNKLTRKRKTKTTMAPTTTSNRRRRTKTTTTLKPELMNEFKAKPNEFLELPCGYESDENDDQIKWAKVGGELPKGHKIRNNKMLLTFLKPDDAGIYKCTTAYDECYKFRITIEEEKEKPTKKEKKSKKNKDLVEQTPIKKAPSPMPAIIKLFKSVNDASKSNAEKTTTTEEVEYYDDETTAIIKTTTAKNDEEDEDEEEEEANETTTRPSDVEYYDDDEPIQVTVTSGSPAELVCGDSTQFDEYIDWARPDKSLSADAYQQENKLIIPVASADDTGSYECETPQGDIYKFEVIVEPVDIDAVCEEATVANFNAVVGEHTEFTCGQESTEHDDLIEWEKIEGKLPSSNRKEANKLILEGLKKEDAGMYRCMNAYAECFKFDLFLEDERDEVEIFAEMGAYVELTCSESTQYDSYIRWRKLDGVIGFESRREANNLVIPYMSEYDIGTYECKDVNGLIHRFKLETIEPEESEQQPEDSGEQQPDNNEQQPEDNGEQTNDVKKIKALHNGQVTLVCGNNPAERVQWNKRDGIITEYKQPYENILTIYYLNEQDSGIYECKNLNGDLLKTFKLKVEKPNVETNDETTPSLNGDYQWPSRPDNNDYQSQSRPENAEDDEERRRAPHSENYGRLGSQIEFSCGTNPLDRSIEWKRLDGGRSISKNNLKNGNKIVLYNLSWDDQGDYECKTPEGKYFRFRLYMLDKDENDPRSQSTKRSDTQNNNLDIKTKLGSTVELACGQPSAQDKYIEWRKLDGYIGKNTDIRRNKLIINDIQDSDSGIYECNTYDKQYYRFNVQTTSSSPSWGLVNGFFTNCKFNQTTCKNGECIARDSYCDGKKDCQDGSDEIDCENPYFRGCQPNERACKNDKCAPRHWFCDGESDCEDNSDEESCPIGDPIALCKPTEWQCKSGIQCVGKGFLCDKEFDCDDNSDEMDCDVPKITVTPARSISVCAGEQFEISCEAKGFPLPTMNWRLNWGHTCLGEKRCFAFDEDGKSKLAVSDARLTDAGSYSCEAYSTMGSTFSKPETIVTVRDCSSNQVSSINNNITDDSSTSPSPFSSSSFVVISANKTQECNCNNHTAICTCTGRCIACRHNTKGKNCEQCADGFVGDATKGTPTDCIPIPGKIQPLTSTLDPLIPLLPDPEDPNCKCNNHSYDCNCQGVCLNCQHNTFGDKCQYCKRGFIGDATKGTGIDCVPEPTRT